MVHNHAFMYYTAWLIAKVLKVWKIGKERRNKAVAWKP